MANFTILEPMSTGDVIDRTVRLYRRNFTPMVAVVAIPTLIGYISSMMFWFGYLRLLGELEPQSATGDFDATAMILLGLGTIGYPVWFFALVFTVAALSRVVGDHIMLGEPVTFRNCLSAVRRRLGDLTLMGLLAFGLLLALSMVLWIVIFAIIMIVGLIIGAINGLGLPPWLVVVITTIAVLLAIAGGIYVLLHVMARVIFLPQVVMIEGQSAGTALNRAMSLGSGNWYRVGAILLFTYFISLSLLAAFTLPFIGVLEYLGLLSTEFFLSPLWNIVYTAFNQISNLLVWPIWIVSFTLLYFDSRVRKEAYDLELLAREVSPGFFWQPVVRPPVFGYYPHPGFSYPRPYVQTSPLGLAGFMPRPAPPQPPHPIIQDRSQGYQNIVPRLDATPKTETSTQIDLESKPQTQATVVDRTSSLCWNCGSSLQPGAQFCIHCGKRVAEE